MLKLAYIYIYINIYKYISIYIYINIYIYISIYIYIYIYINNMNFTIWKYMKYALIVLILKELS